MNRIYEYEDEKGRVFWSRHRLEPTVTFGHTLRLKDRLGDHYLLFSTKLRDVIESLKRE
jgi:hypothetical protein